MVNDILSDKRSLVERLNDQRITGFNAVMRVREEAAARITELEIEMAEAEARISRAMKNHGEQLAALRSAPSATRPTLRDKYVNAFIATAAGPAFSRDELRKEALAIVEGRGPYAPDPAAPAIQRKEALTMFCAIATRNSVMDGAEAVWLGLSEPMRKTIVEFANACAASSTPSARQENP